MPTVVRCPECGERVQFANDMVGRRTRCPECDHRFIVEITYDEGMREGQPRHGVRGRDWDDDMERRVRRRRAEPAAAPAVLIGVIAGIFLLTAGGVLAWVLWSGAPAPVQVAGPQVPNALPHDAPKQENNAVPPAHDAPKQENSAVPPAVVAGADQEEFVDLPERGKDVDRIAGLDVPAAPPKNVPTKPNAPVKVLLTNGQATRTDLPIGANFQVDYEFAQGGPLPGRRYIWTVRTARGRVFTQTVLALQARGTLSGRVLGSIWPDAPYQTYLSVETPFAGMGPGIGPRFGPGFGPRIGPLADPFDNGPLGGTRQERISDVVEMR